MGKGKFSPCSKIAPAAVCAPPERFAGKGEAVSKSRKLWYNKSMEMEIVFVPSAFKHTVSEENIRWVLLNHIADEGLW